MQNDVPDMREEILQQPNALRDLLEDKEEILQIGQILYDYEKIFCVGCGSSLSTLFSVKSVSSILSKKSLDVHTGFEFYYNTPQCENSAVILTSQSGETSDVVSALKRAKEKRAFTIGITNEADSTLAKKADKSIITNAGHEKAIIATKTYINQMATLYLFLGEIARLEGNKNTLLSDIQKLPQIIEDMIKATEKKEKENADHFKEVDGFYVLGSGPNYGLAYKTAMTLLMEGVEIHGCPVLSGEFRHGLIERVEKGIPVIFLTGGYESDEITKKAMSFCENLGCNMLVYDFNWYKDHTRNISNLCAPFILVIPLEWFTYYSAQFRGKDPGATRHIGKVRY